MDRDRKTVTEATDRVYMCMSMGYRILAADALVRHWGWGVFYHDTYHLKVRLYQPQGMTVASYQVVIGIHHMFIVGYIVPGNITTTEDIVVAFGHLPHMKLSMMANIREGMMMTHCHAPEGEQGE